MPAEFAPWKSEIAELISVDRRCLNRRQNSKSRRINNRERIARWKRHRRRPDGWIFENTQGKVRALGIIVFPWKQSRKIVTRASMAFSIAFHRPHIRADRNNRRRMHGTEVTSSGRFPRIASSLWVADGPASKAPWTGLIPAVSIDRRSVSVSIIRAERRAVQPSRRSPVERNSREGETGWEKRGCKIILEVMHDADSRDLWIASGWDLRPF